jgi:hypothetical protein
VLIREFGYKLLGLVIPDAQCAVHVTDGDQGMLVGKRDTRRQRSRSSQHVYWAFAAQIPKSKPVCDPREVKPINPSHS